MHEELPSREYLFSLADKTASVLENEIADYRTAGKNGKAGGLLDFTNLEKKPLVIVPDLHARTYFIENLMNFIPHDFASLESKGEPKPLSVFEALEKKLIRIVCVGDLLHSESRGKFRWFDAEIEFENGIIQSQAMTEEMKEGLNLLCMVMELKCAFPESFHILKGNHENILNETGMGNYAFKKFCNEGEMCYEFMENVYGEETTYVVSCFEKSLPLFAAFPTCVISHAEPYRSYSRNELIDGLTKGNVIEGLTWTENGRAKQGSVESLIALFCDKTKFKYSHYFAGHRPVRGKYALRQNGYFVQFHNPNAQNVVLIYPEKKFDFETDIVSVEGK